MIDRFSGDYAFLSNMYPCLVVYDNVTYPSVEHAYVAAKTLSLVEREKVLNCNTPKEAKRLGKKLTLREDWEDIKLGVMVDLVLQKFSNCPILKKKLLDTGDQYIVEGNW